MTKNYPNHLGRCSVLVLGCMSILMENSLGSPKLKQLGGHDPDPRATGFSRMSSFSRVSSSTPHELRKMKHPWLPHLCTTMSSSVRHVCETLGSSAEFHHGKTGLSRSLRGFTEFTHVSFTTGRIVLLAFSPLVGPVLSATMAQVPLLAREQEWLWKCFP